MIEAWWRSLSAGSVSADEESGDSCTTRTCDLLIFDQMLTRCREATGAESGRFPHVRSATMRRSEHRRERIVHNWFWRENAWL
jgi:hypothetical protein